MKAKLCFVIDATSSMKEHFDMAKYKINTIIQDFKQDFPLSDILVAILAYRDYEDKEKIEKLNFTTNMDKINIFLEMLDAKGGRNDDAEDVLEVYQYLNCVDWDADYNLIFHITDAPAHGDRYHDDSVTDNYPLERLTEELDREVGVLGLKEVSLTLFKINDTTDIMYKRFSSIFESVSNSTVIITDFYD